MSRRLCFIVLGLLQFGGANSSRAEESPLPSADYGVSTIWQLGGIGGWYYLTLEPSGARLFVSRGDRVDVRRRDILPTLEAVLTPADIVAQDDQDVWLPSRGRVGPSAEQEGQESGCEHQAFAAHGRSFPWVGSGWVPE